MSDYHTSVLLQETIFGLQVKQNGLYIDATLGGGGHTQKIVESGGKVLGIDQDDDALMFVSHKLTSAIDQGRLTVAKGNFAQISEIAHQFGFVTVNGILFDLGISSHQVDEGSRGFSFQKEAPLDMRMDQDATVSAADLVNGLNKGELIELFEKLGEEVFAKRIAESIVRVRTQKPITTTLQLAQLVKEAYPKGFHKVHPATKVFQALRIAVNDELRSIRTALPQALELLTSGGRICVISFHSLEDRIVKETFEDFVQEGLGMMVTQKPIVPTPEEIEANPRSRSSKLRIFEKI